MTSSNQDKPLTNTGTSTPVTPEDAKYLSNRGTAFDIIQTPNGLFSIHMKKGGKAPKFCDELFTSHQHAERVLEMYLLENDRLGLARYPSKDK